MNESIHPVWAVTGRSWVVENHLIFELWQVSDHVQPPLLASHRNWLSTGLLSMPGVHWFHVRSGPAREHALFHQLVKRVGEDLLQVALTEVLLVHQQVCPVMGYRTPGG